MKILLIAYEFPPSPSPQSLRWTYLSRELLRHGHEVHVLTPDLGPELGTTNATLDSRLVMHRTYAGPVRGLVAARPHAAATRGAHGTGNTQPLAAPQLRRGTLKTRVVNTVFRLSERLWFPDVRGEWKPFARRALDALLAAERFDVMISSHEPATCIELALHARRNGIPWIADLGDPVLAPYTPRRWRRRAGALEHRALAEADRVTVTAASAAELLGARHRPARAPYVLTQGFEPRPPTPMPDGETLELVYVGSFYAFRRAEALFEAVAATPGVRLTVATVALPDSLRAIARAAPDRFRLAGFVSHDAAVALQARAHVLVNIANRDASQVPGKLYEYLGAARPVLHVTHGGDDPGARLVERLSRGWVVEDDGEHLRATLEMLRDGRHDGRWLSGVDLSPAPIQPYSWPALGAQLDALVREVARG